jgi:hypothetical protein
MTQPSIIPRFATDTNFATGPATGTPTKVDRGAGARAQGIIGNAVAYAQWENHEKNLVGEHLRSLAAYAVDNWSPQHFDDSISYQLNTSSRARAFGIGTRLAWPTLSATAGPFAYTDHNFENVTIAGTGSLGFTDWATCWGDSSGRVITADISAGTLMQTTNLGTTWSTAGTIGFGLVNYLQAGRFDLVSRWILVGEEGADANAIFSSSSLSGTWTFVSPPAAVLTASTAVPLDFQQSPSEVLVAFSNGYIIRSTDGTSWSAALLPNYLASIAGISWNAAHGLWACLGTTGKVWYSSDGSSWSDTSLAVGTFPAGCRVASLGRYWIAGASDGDGVVRFDQDEFVNLPEFLGGSAAFDSYYHPGSGRAVVSYTGANDLHFKLSGRIN